MQSAQTVLQFGELELSEEIAGFEGASFFQGVQGTVHIVVHGVRDAEADAEVRVSGVVGTGLGQRGNDLRQLSWRYRMRIPPGKRGETGKLSAGSQSSHFGQVQGLEFRFSRDALTHNPIDQQVKDKTERKDETDQGDDAD